MILIQIIPNTAYRPLVRRSAAGYRMHVYLLICGFRRRTARLLRYRTYLRPPRCTSYTCIIQCIIQCYSIQLFIIIVYNVIYYIVLYIIYLKRRGRKKNHCLGSRGTNRLLLLLLLLLCIIERNGFNSHGYLCIILCCVYAYNGRHHARRYVHANENYVYKYAFKFI